MGELGAQDALRRETAVARLAVIGPRAATKLTALAGDGNAPLPARTAAFQALESIADPRAASAALAALAHPDDALAIAAIAVLGPIARGTDGGATRAFERLTSLAVSAEVSVERRLAALAAFDGFPDRLLKPLFDTLARDSNPAIVARVTRTKGGATLPLDALIDRGLPDDPAVLAAVVREEADKTRVTLLRRLIDAISSQERRAPPGERAAWMAVRGQVHQALAGRSSRLALYDLRETLEQAHGPLPVGFLAAAAAIGDAACLEPLASAWVASDRNDRWWRDHVVEAFRAIVKREDLTRRHAALRRVLERCPAAGVLVASARRG
jgi:hypothetical protein